MATKSLVVSQPNVVNWTPETEKRNSPQNAAVAGLGCRCQRLCAIIICCRSVGSLPVDDAGISCCRPVCVVVAAGEDGELVGRRSTSFIAIISNGGEKAVGTGGAEGLRACFSKYTYRRKGRFVGESTDHRKRPILCMSQSCLAEVQCGTCTLEPQ